MWNRRDLKTDAKDFLWKNLKTSILVCLLFTIISGFFAYEATVSDNLRIYTTNQLQETYSEEFYSEEFTYYDENGEPIESEYNGIINNNNSDDEIFLNDNSLKNGEKGILSLNLLGSLGLDFYGLGGRNLTDNLNINLLSGVLSIKVPILILPIFIIAFLIFSIFIINPLTVGIYSFFIRGYTEEPKVKYLFSYFKNNSWASLAGKLLLRDIYIFLWSLLFIIPGIIKTYEYYYVEYILAENPEIPLSEAIKLSKQMTRGEKFDIFVLEISFFGWALLAVLSFNLGSLILNPYIFATKARLYLFKKEQYEQLKQQEQFNYYNELNNNH